MNPLKPEAKSSQNISDQDVLRHFGGLEASVVAIDGVALEWVTGNALGCLLDPTSGSDGLDSLLGQEVNGVAIVASDALSLAELRSVDGSPLAVWNLLGDVLAGGGPGGGVWNGVGVVGAGNAGSLGVWSDADVGLEEAVVMEGGVDALLDDLGAVQGDLVGVAWLADSTVGDGLDVVVLVDEAGVIGWLSLSTSTVGEDLPLEATLAVAISVEDGAAVVVDGGEGGGGEDSDQDEFGVDHFVFIVE